MTYFNFFATLLQNHDRERLLALYRKAATS